MNLSIIGYQQRKLVLLSLVLTMALGVLSYFSLPAQEDPSITLRESVVTTNFPGLQADKIESLITQPLEEVLITIKGVEELRSTSTDGRSIIYVKGYDHLTTELDQVWNEVEEAVQSVHGQLPNGTSRPHVNDQLGDVAVITLALTGEDYSLSEIHNYAQHARTHLVTTPGTRAVDILGEVEERIFIEIENAVSSEIGISADTIIASLRDQNIIDPAGEIDTGDRAFSLKVSGEFKSTKDIENLPIRNPSDGAIYTLKDFAKVITGYADPAQQRAFYNGKEAIVLSVVMQNGVSVLNYSESAKDAIEALKETLPLGLNLDVITWQADQVENAVYGVSLNVLQTLVIVLAVVILFLGVRTGLIVGSIVPAVVLVTLTIMGFTGITLERMSLATMVIALGLLVDNGVVIAEDFKRRLGEHGDRDLALKETGRELAIPLLTSSLSTILVFVPLMLAQHSSGEYTRNISLVILITLTVSWFLALMVTPTLCHMFLKAPSDEDKAQEEGNSSNGPFGVIERGYASLLRLVLRKPLLFVIAMFALLPIGLFLVASSPVKFFPNSDRPQVLIYVNLPAGVTTRTTEARMKDMMDIIGDKKRYPYLEDYAGYVGFGGPRFVLSLAPLDPAPHVGFIVVNAKDREAASDAIVRLREDFRREVTDVEARVSAMFLGSSDPNVLQIQVKGPDANYIFEQSKKVEAFIAEIPGTIDIWTNWYNPVTRFEVDINQNLAKSAGITSSDVARSIAANVSGYRVSEFRDSDEVFPIMVRAPESERSDLSRLETLSIFPSNSADVVPLGQIAKINRVPGFAHIQREDLVRTVTIEARNLRLSPEDMAPLIRDKIDALNATLSRGHLIEFDGVVKDSVTGRAALFANFPICLLLIALLLIAQFNGYRRPLIVMLTIPLIMIGVGIGLQLMRAEFGFIVILGLFALAGIIVNNAIVLIDRIDIERSANPPSDWDAVVTASARRLRPILITTITTIIGLLPLIIGNDVLFYGMASVMAFGLGIGTVLTLGVAPALYCLFFGIRAETATLSQGDS